MVAKEIYQRWLMNAIILCAGLGGILYGYDIGVISGALEFMKHTINLSMGQQEVIVGAVLAGGLLGTVVTGALADNFGRRTMILAACLVFGTGVTVILSATTFTQLLGARLLLGIGVGIVAVAVPLYLSEIAPNHLRGRSVTMFQIFLTLGIVVAYLVDLLFTHSQNWHAMFAIILIPTVILFVSMIFLPETPRWLLSRGRDKEARQILQLLRPQHMVEVEIDIIKEGLHQTSGSWQELFSRHSMRPLAISLIIAVSNQLTGINVILQYAPQVMHMAGMSSQLAAMMATLGIGALNFISTLVAMVLVDRVGRKKLLMFGTGGVVLVNIYLGLCAYFLPTQGSQSIFVLFGLLVYIVVFAVGPGVVVWLAISELLPTRVRGKAIALALFVNSLTATILSSCFLTIQAKLGMAATYWLFAAFTVIYFITAKYFLPETKGQALEEIQKHYQQPSKVALATA